MELKARVLNINENFNKELKEQCRTLGEYMRYVDKVRSYAKDMSIGEAVDRAVSECIRQDILRGFLLKNKAEVKRMSIFEYDEEATRRAIRDNAYERGVEDGESKGYERGRREGILQLLEDTGPVPEKLRKEIMLETDDETLKRWLRIAARVESIEDFNILQSTFDTDQCITEK